MTTLQEAAKQALEALEHIQRCIGFATATIHQGSATWCQSEDAIASIKAALAPQAQEPAPQPASEMVANFIVSAVVIKDTSTGFNTQNKLYPVSAANSDEATGKALPLVTNDFPEHRLHTMCFIQTAPAPQAQEPAPQPAQWESLNLAREVLKLNALWNKSTVQAPEISDQLGICRVLAERVNTDD